jgi:NAD(P)-dependent dehydrogenase (short-subunit alcohol dehydrogenase family)
MVSDPSTLRATLAAGSDASVMAVYAASKFVQLLGAHWWRRELGTACTVLAVSPGLIPGTGLARHSDHKLPTDHPDAKSVAEGSSVQV